MLEKEIQSRILLEFGTHARVRLWRNNSGALKDRNGHLVRFGLPGSSDIIGVIKPSGRIICIEVKTLGGRQTDQQKLFQTMIEFHGGIYILAFSDESARTQILEVLKWN